MRVKKIIFNNAIQTARDHGGECLSKLNSCIAYKNKLHWRCSKGHEWQARASHVIYDGTWCPECVRLGRFDNIERMQAIAISRGGKCLTEQFVNHHSKLSWECQLGHQWEAQPSTIVHGGCWCPYCVGKNQTIDDLKDLAKFRNGKCLSSTYRGNDKKYEWECSKKHQWSTVASSVRQGKWCPKCAIEVRALKQRLETLEKAQKAAQAKDGECLSTIDEYNKGSSYIRFKCKNDHIWKAIPSSIISKKSWCPKCHISKIKKTIEEMHELAKSKGGECLSVEYISSDKSLLWRCKNGHKFKRCAKDIINNQKWCNECLFQNITISDAHNLAREKGGQCLAEVAKSTYSLLLWECSHGHQWRTTYLKAKESWCSECSEIKSKVVLKQAA